MISNTDLEKAWFTQIIKGRRDYENLIPATVGIKKHKNQQNLFLPNFERPGKHGSFKAM